MPRSNKHDERQLIADIYSRAQEQRARKVAGAPEVGIFWVYGGRPLIDGTPITEAESYGGLKTHPRDHYTVWGQYQRVGIVPKDVEYDEVPRGRVVYDTASRRFTFFADRKILADKGMVNKICDDLHLPSSQILRQSDPHYRT